MPLCFLLFSVIYEARLRGGCPLWTVGTVGPPAVAQFSHWPAASTDCLFKVLRHHQVAVLSIWLDPTVRGKRNHANLKATETQNGQYSYKSAGCQVQFCFQAKGALLDFFFSVDDLLSASFLTCSHSVQLPTLCFTVILWWIWMQPASHTFSLFWRMSVKFEDWCSREGGK